MKNIKFFLFETAFMLFCFCSQSQITNPLNTVKDKSSDRANDKIDNGVDKGLDKVEGVFKKKDKNGKDTNKTQTKQASENSTSSSNVNSTKGNSLQSYSKYDFVPGEKVLYYDDFSQDAIGDFPAGWNTDKSGEVVTTNNFSGKWFKLKDEGSFVPEKYDTVGPNFTVEFDAIPIKDGKISFYIYQAANPQDLNEGGAIPGIAGLRLWLSTSNNSFSCYGDGILGLEGSSTDGLLQGENVNKIKIWVQKQRVRVYIEEIKIFDIIKALTPGTKVNAFRFLSESGENPMISNIRIATGLPDMRSKLLTDGKLVSYGCYFDSGSSILKPESYGTLKEIAAVLKENPTVKIKIVGHTDSDGSDALNLDLSKKRAAAVKSALNSEFSIDNSRIETDGMGSTQPIAPNATSEGKAKNRRVEFIKI